MENPMEKVERCGYFGPKPGSLKELPDVLRVDSWGEGWHGGGGWQKDTTHWILYHPIPIFSSVLSVLGH